MSDEKKILHEVTRTGNFSADYVFWCPGCKETHGVWTTHRNGVGAVWSFNGNMTKPTFSPSLLLRYTKLPPVDPSTGDFQRDANGNYLTQSDGKISGCKEAVCHSIIKDGVIHFCNDCTHELAGKSVPMEAF